MFEVLQELLRSTDFVGKVLLLILGAVLTGMLVPFVKARLDEGGAKRKKLLEAELARQSELIDSQIKLLREFSGTCWEFLYAAFRVSYTHAFEGEKAQEAAHNEYGPLSWKLLAEIRATISVAKRLTSEDTQSRLLETYDWLIDLDNEVSERADEGASTDEWASFHRERFVEAGHVIDKAIESLATDLELSSSKVAGSSVIARRRARDRLLPWRSKASLPEARGDSAISEQG